MSKDNLDKLFQEKFKDFGELPDDKVWQRLEASLDEKKKNRKVIPIWWKLGGIAAALALLFFVINPFEKEENVAPAITDTEKIELNTDGQIVNEDVEPKITIEEKPQEDTTGSGVVESVDDIEIATAKNDKEKIGTGKSLKQEASISNNSLTNGTAVSSTKDLANIANSSGKNNVGGSKNSSTNMAMHKDTVGVASIFNQEINKNGALHKDVASNVDSKGSSILQKNKDLILDKNKSEAVVKQDTIIKKSIYDEIRENEEEDAIAANKANKWSVGANVAPVYFNSLKDGSPVDPSFVSNSKSGNVNMSYGVTVAYAVSKKLSVRSGVHKVDYGFNTNNVFFKSTFSPEHNSMVSTIDYDAGAESIVVETNNDALSAPQNIKSEEYSYAAKSTSREGTMVQQFGYIEIPLELNYALTEGKFGVNLIGGVSSLFLVDDSISLESDNLKTKIGESSTINSLNFSTNVGFGLNYNFTKKVRFNIEPMFKYQLNTFSNSSGDFQPFSMGVYSGLSFKF